MQPTPSPSMAAPAVERRREDRRAPRLPKDVAVSHYQGQLAAEHLAILLPAARRASLALARFTPAGLHEGSPVQALQAALKQIGGAA